MFPKPSSALAIALLAVAVIASCAGDSPSAPGVSREAPIVPLDTGTVRVTTDAAVHEVSVEIAETFEQQSIGLMDRDHLPADEGMIFVYSAMHAGSFYMFRTRIPLDIAFFDDAGRIVSILAMTPCESTSSSQCERYSPGTPYIGALEVNAGFFASRGIDVGDRIVLIRGEEGAEVYWPQP